MAQEYIEVYRTGLTTSSFSVKIQIAGTTSLWILTVRYIAIDSSFPHHLNSFDNVPVNYSRGLLTNITVASTSPKYYTNVINYTEQATAQGYTYKTFTPPYTNYKILLFLTSFFINGNNESPSEARRPLDLTVVTPILSNSTYMFNVSIKIVVRIWKLHFSMIIFDQANV